MLQNEQPPLNVFNRQPLGEFLSACSMASEMLKAERLTRTNLSPWEGIVLQAAACIVAVRPHFHGQEVKQFAQIQSGTLYPILTRFEEQYLLTTGELEDADPRELERPLRKLYTPTELGQVVLAAFQPKQ